MNYHILVYVIILLLNTYDSKNTVIVPVRPYGVKGGINDSSLDIYTRLRKKVIFSPPNSSFDYKNVSLSFLGPVLPCLPLCISHKHPMIINSLFAHHFVLHWILSLMTKKAELQEVLGLSEWFQLKDKDLSPILGQGLWVQVSIWGVARFEYHLGRSMVQFH